MIGVFWNDLDVQQAGPHLLHFLDTAHTGILDWWHRYMGKKKKRKKIGVSIQHTELLRPPIYRRTKCYTAFKKTSNHF